MARANIAWDFKFGVGELTMKYAAITIVAVFLLAGCAANLTNVPIKSSNEIVNAPVFKVGDSWEYSSSRGNYRVAVVGLDNNNGSIITDGRFPGVKLFRDKNLVIRKIEGPLEVDQRNLLGWQYLKFPIIPGDKFAYEVMGASGVKEEVGTEADGFETIQVPAGTFRALKLKVCWGGKLPSDPPGPWAGCRDIWQTVWYAPEVKTIIKRVVEPGAGWNYELVKFSLKN